MTDRHDTLARALVQQQAGHVRARVVPCRVGRGLRERDQAGVDLRVEQPLLGFRQRRRQVSPVRPDDARVPAARLQQRALVGPEGPPT